MTRDGGLNIGLRCCHERLELFCLDHVHGHPFLALKDGLLRDGARQALNPREELSVELSLNGVLSSVS